jgi:hypothetical protein
MCILKQKIKKANELRQKFPLNIDRNASLYEENPLPTVNRANEEPIIDPKNDLKIPILPILRLDSIMEPDLKLNEGVLAPDRCKSLGILDSTACNSQNTSRNVSNSSLMEEKPEKPKRKAKKQKTRNPTKNISINYGKAIISFAISHVALPYLAEFFDDFDYCYSRFVNFLKDCRKRMNGMHALKSFLIVEKKDDEEMRQFKYVFQKISEVFINYFSINWITYGKVSEKLVYLKYRSKMLRRIKNPEMFTYIHKNHGCGLSL